MIIVCPSKALKHNQNEEEYLNGEKSLEREL